MNRQALFDHMVKTLNGKGRAYGLDCVYFPTFDAPDGSGRHPGCAIGCQPGFREKFEGIMGDRGTISTLINGTYKYDNNDKNLSTLLKEFFGIENNDDVLFLSDLQLLHDDTQNWKDNSLKQEAITKFVTQYNLQNSCHSMIFVVY